MDYKKTFTVSDLPKSERPRERLKQFGAEALSLQELLALVISRGVSKRSVMIIAQDLLVRFGSIKAISEASLEELSQIKGIGFAKAVQLKACFELGKRKDLEPELKDFSIKDPQTVIKAIQSEIKDKAKEHFKLILLNTRNKIIGISTVSIGSLSASIVHPREVFKDAIMHSANSVVLAHNHPSGDPEPSGDDLKITKRLADAGRILGIEVLDHLIIGKDRHFSFKEKGLI